jgi:hypothetical protein
MKYDLIIIQGDMTGMFLTLDVIINWPYAAHISYSEWTQKTYNMMPTAFLKKAILTQMCEWVFEAWERILQKALKLLAMN